MKGMLLPGNAPPAPLGSLPGRHVGLKPDDRHDPGRFRFPEQLDRAVQIAVIRQCNRRHSQRLGTLDQIRNLARTVQKTVVAVAMKMHERQAGHRDVTRGLAARRAAGQLRGTRVHPNVPVAIPHSCIGGGASEAQSNIIAAGSPIERLPRLQPTCKRTARRISQRNRLPTGRSAHRSDRTRQSSPSPGGDGNRLP